MSRTHFARTGPDERLRDSEVLDLLLGLMQNRQLASQSLTQQHLPLPALMRQLAARFFRRLRGSACTAPLPWVLGQVRAWGVMACCAKVVDWRMAMGGISAGCLCRRPRDWSSAVYKRLVSCLCLGAAPQVIRTEMLRALDGGPNSLTLHQAYIFLTSEHSAPQDLHLSMQVRARRM